MLLINAFILIIPLITLVLSLLLRAASGPFWQYADSCYIDLINAIEVLKGQVPTDISHPGTPLQILFAFIIRILDPWHPIAQVVHHALENPEFYIGALYFFLTFSAFLTSMVLAAYVYRKTNDKLAALLTQLPQLSFLILPSFDNGSFPVLPVVANTNGEPFFMSIMNLFNLFLLGLYFSKNKSQILRNVLLLALVCGLGLAIKLNFLFVLLSGLLLVPWRKKLLFIFVCALSFVVSTLPVISRYHELFQWASDIVGHSARYGLGSKQFIDWGSFFYYCRTMIHYDWFFVFFALVSLAWSTVKLIKDRQDTTNRFLSVVSFCCLLHLMATAKHFSFHYLLPGFGLFSSIFLLFYLDHKDKSKILKPLTVAFILIFSLVYIFTSIDYYKRLQVLSLDIRHFNDNINAKYPECNIIPSTTGDIDLFLNQQEGIQRADASSYRLQSDELMQLYPHGYYFYSEEVTTPENVESYGIWDSKHRVMADEIVSSCPCVIFIKYNSDFSAYPYQVRLIERSKYLNAYLLLNSTERAANELFAQAMDSFNSGNFQQALVFGLKSRQLNYEPAGQLNYFLMVTYHELLRSKGR